MHKVSKLALLLLTAGVLLAQQPKPLIRVALFKVDLTKSDDLISAGKQYVPVLDNLLNAGTILSYGIERSILHVKGEDNVGFWYVTPDFAALDKAEAAINAFEAKTPELLVRIASLTNLNDHSDLILTSEHSNVKSSSACVPKNFAFSMHQAKSGRLADDSAHFAKYWKPVLDPLVAQGAICGYSYDVEMFHTMAPGMVTLAVMMPNLGGMDKLISAFDAARGKMDPTERQMLEMASEANIVAGSHRDALSEVIVYKSK